MPNEIYNILIVEDEWINAQFMTQILESFNHNVVGRASSSKEALIFVQENKLDFIFMDINIDGACDGIMLAKQIMQIKNIPIIYMTAFGDSYTIQEASQTNIYGFIIKPFAQQEVEAVLNVAIQRIKHEKKERTQLCSIPYFQLDLGSGYIYDFDKNILLFKTKSIILSKNESKLLTLFCKNHGYLVPNESIRMQVWSNKEVGESTIRDTILRLRKKISPLVLENIIGMGYILKKEKN